MAEINARVILFTRYPEPGAAKTRLIPVLGAEGAADLHRRMTEHACGVLTEIAGNDVAIEIAVTGDEDAARAWLSPYADVISQGEGGLGLRMERVFRSAFEKGATRAVIIGSDCPALTSGHLQQALAVLRDHAMVLGPASDGGYYLIGLRADALEDAAPCLTRMAWGTEQVLRETLRRARVAGLGVALLEELADVDRPEDLHLAAQVNEALRPRLSVVIPCLNEAEVLPQTLQRIDTAAEVIAVDGGSMDATVAVAREYGAHVVTAGPGRARQLNAGARKARSDNLLFLHADTLLPPGHMDVVERSLASAKVAGGAFRFSTDAEDRAMRLIAWGANFRARFFSLPYGDQGLFMRASTFHALGGFPDIPLMEDYVFVKWLKRRGRVVIAQETVVTSSRRWRRLGPWRTFWLNQAIVAAYHAGVPPERLAGWYRRLS